MEERPKVAEVILERRTGEHESLARSKGEGCLRRLALRVLDVLTFVEHDGAKLSTLEQLAVATQKRVRGDDQLVLAEDDLLSLGRRTTAETGDDDVGTESLALVLPVEDETRRTDDEHRSFRADARCDVVFATPEEMGERHHRLSETHLVREDSADRPTREPAEPTHGLVLVWSQHLLEPIRERRNLEPLATAQRRGEIAKLVLEEEVGLVVVRDELGDSWETELERLLLVLAASVSTDELRDRVDAVVRKTEHRAVLELQDAFGIVHRRSADLAEVDRKLAITVVE